jgi:hypothetical protein
MRFSEELIRHAIRLLGNPPGPLVGSPASVDMRRAVSAAYYALFHHLSEAAVEQIAPYASSQTANRIHRWLDHAEMKKICGEFAAVRLNPPLCDLLGDTASEDMQTLAINFIRLQEARHSADYDLDYPLSWGQAKEFITLAVNAIGAWDRICPSAESNIFVLSLLLWKKWAIVRP